MAWFSLDAATLKLPASQGVFLLNLRRELGAISALNLPVLLLLKDGRTAVLRRFADDGKALILPSEADGGEQWVSREELAEHYSGQALFARPRHELEDLRSPLVPRVHAWFRDTLKLSKWLYSDAILASFLINLLGLMVPLFVMQTYDRVVPNQATSTLWVLAIGLLVGTGFELLLIADEFDNKANDGDSPEQRKRALMRALLDINSGAGSKFDPYWVGMLSEVIKLHKQHYQR